jgi:uncharacterized delta-60 repeat protein
MTRHLHPPGLNDPRGFSALRLVALLAGLASSGLAQAPVVTTPPRSQAALVGQAATLSVTVTGAGPLAYRWVRNGETIAGATGATLTVPSLTVADRGWYQVTVTNPLGTVTSVCHLQVSPANLLAIAWGEDASGETVPPAGLRNLLAVVGGYRSSVALRDDATVVAWGLGANEVPPGLTNIVALSTSGRHVLVLRADGTITGWGENWSNQLLVPPDLTNVVSVAAGSNHSLALRADGTVAAWGRNSDGQTTVPPGLAEVVAIAAGGAHSVALKADGTVVCWGVAGTTSPPIGLTGVIALAAGYSHSLALKADGTVAAWGLNVQGQASVPADLAGVMAIAAGSDHSLALKKEGTIAFWGSNSYNVASPPAGLPPAAGIAAGSYHTLALAVPTPVTVTAPPTAATVTAGGSATLSAVVGGAIPTYQWFRDGIALGDWGGVSGSRSPNLAIARASALDAGEYVLQVTNPLGAVTTPPVRLTVVAAAGGPPVLTSWPLSQRVVAGQPVSLTVASNHSGPLTYQWKRNGEAIAGATQATLAIAAAQANDRGWYEVRVANDSGQAAQSYAWLDLSSPDGVPVAWGVVGANTPATAPSGIHDLVGVAAGGDHLAGWKADGSLVVWGGETGGTAVTSPSLGPVVALAVNRGATVLKADGTVAEWWIRTLGASGLPRGLSKVAKLIAGRSRVIALRSDGSMVTWGSSAWIDVPANLGPVVDAVAGDFFIVALRPDGTVVGLGYGSSGEHAVPSGLNEVVALEGREGKIYAIRRDGTVATWGANAATLPPGTTQIRAAAAGGGHDLFLRHDGSLLEAGNLPAPVVLREVRAISASDNAAVALVPKRAPWIEVQPETQRVAVGGTARFAVTAGGTPFLRYQWTFAGHPLPGATQATLQIADAQLAHTGSYTVTVSNQFGEITSAPALLTGVNPPPAVGTAPGTTFRQAGQDLALTVGATGAGPLAYQWFRDGNTLPGATDATLQLGAATLAMNGRYVVRVTDGLAATVTPPALVQVRPTAFPEVVSRDAAAAVAFEQGGGSVAGFVPLPDGKVLAFGSFSRIHRAPARNIGRLNPDGYGDPTFTPPAIDGPVYAAAVQSDGRIVIGGGFTRVGGLVRPGVARLQADGTLDPSFAPTGDFDAVYALAVLSTGRIVVGGDFSGQLAALNPDGSTVTSFAPAPDGPVYALLPWSDGRVIVGGAFDRIAGLNGAGLARLDAAGAYDPTFAAGIGFNGPVYALGGSSGDHLVVGGAFTSYNWTVANRIIALLPGGGIDPAWTPGSGFNSSVYGLNVAGDGSILAAGSFGGYGGTNATAVARLSRSGVLDPEFRVLTLNQSAAAVAPLARGQVALGGYFTYSSGYVATAQGLLVLSDRGVGDFSRSPGLMSPSSVRRFVRLGDGRIVAGGPFEYVNGTSARYLARLSASGELDPTFSTTASGPPADQVDDLVGLPDGRIVMVGSFHSYRSSFINNVARLNPDGSLDPGFQPGGAGSLGIVLGMTADRVWPFTADRLLFAGRTWNSPTRNLLQAIKPDGSLDDHFTVSALPGGEIHAVAVQSDGKVLVGGSFRSFGGSPCNFLVRLLPDGARDASFTGGTDDTVRDLVLQPDGRILIAGDFLAAGDSPRPRVARLLPDGSLDTTFQPNFTLNAAATLLRPQPDGRIFVSGEFDSVSGHPVARHLIRLQPDGTFDSSFAAPGLTAQVTELALTESGALWLSGGEITLGDQSAGGLVRTRSESGPLLLVSPAGSTLLSGMPYTLDVAVAGGDRVTYQWFKNGSAVAGATAPALRFAAVRPGDTGSYQVRITHGPGLFVASAAATLEVRDTAPVPAGGVRGAHPGALKNGSAWSLEAPTLAAASLPVGYQWYRNGTALAGATGRTLLLPSWQPGDAGGYQVVISNAHGVVATPLQMQSVVTTPDAAWQLPAPQGNDLFALQHLNGRFLGGGAGGTILSSVNGTDWSVVRLGVSNPVLGFAFGNGRYLAFGDHGSLWTSTDGLNWTQRDSGLGRDGRFVAAVSFGAGRFVAVGQAGLVASSPDGMAWTPGTGVPSDALGAVAHGAGRFVALGGLGRTFVSTDGQNWAAGPELRRPVEVIAYGAGRFVAASGKQLFHSADGLAWAQLTLDTTARVTSLQFTSAGFLATLDSTDGRYWRSADGIDWRESTTGLTRRAGATALTHHGGRTLMAGLAPDVLLTAVDDGTWARSVNPATVDFTAVVAGPEALVALGHHGRWRRAADGTAQVRVWPLESYDRINDAVFGNGLYLAVYKSGHLDHSPDGTNWNRLTMSSLSFTGASFANGRFFALGPGGLLLTTTAPQNFQWTTLNSGTSQTLNRLVHGAGTYVTVGANGTVLSSVNATAWIARSSNGVTSQINDLIFADGKFVFVSEGGSIRTSPDGIAWTARANPLGIGLRIVTHAGGRFYAFPATGTDFLTSPDGSVWTAAQHGSAQGVVDVAEFQGLLHLVGAQGAVVTLPLGTNPPAIALPPQSRAVPAGGTATFSASVMGPGPFQYQWFKDEVPVIGATAGTLTLAAVRATDGGRYRVMVTNAAGSVTSEPATLTVEESGLRGSQASAHQAGLLGGAFTLEGSTPKVMLVRAIGPALAGLGVVDFAPNPSLRIIRTDDETVFAANEDWEDAANATAVAAMAAQIGALPLLPGGKDAAVLATFPPGSYRLSVDVSGGGGTVNLEIFESDTTPRLVYLATLAQVGSAGVSHGFVVSQVSPGRTYLVRALGPALGGADALGNPRLTVFAGQTPLAANDDWAGADRISALGHLAGAMPLPAGSRDAALEFVPPAAGIYTAQVTGIGGAQGLTLIEIFELDAGRAPTIPLALIALPRAITVDAGQAAQFGVVTVGKPLPSHHWSKGGVTLPSSGPTLDLGPVQVGDAGDYEVRVTSGTTVHTATATLAVTPTNNATQVLAGRGYSPGGILTITNTLHYTGTPATLGWAVTLPTGWTLAGDTGSVGDVKPATGASGVVSWTWTSPPPSPVTFTYTLHVPAGESGTRTLPATFAINGGSPQPVTPAALAVDLAPPHHAADTSRDFRISLFELTRVIELFNTRSGASRTGCYRVQPGTEDGYGPEPFRPAAAPAALLHHHSADTDRDGRISLFELTRVIELFNFRSGSNRTGQYRIATGTEDGFAPGP